MISVYCKEPSHWELLNDNDKKEYKELQKELSSNICRNIRNQRLDTFKEMLELIRVYVLKYDSDDWKRCLVCGICWLKEGIAINTMQFSLLLGKCKSSVNGSFQRLGYKPSPCSTSNNNELFEKIPYLRQHISDIRQWTLRKKSTYIQEHSFSLDSLNQKECIIPKYDENVNLLNNNILDVFDVWEGD